ncbi:MAG: flavin-containing monooxygenase [Acidimicrobiia bacterium]
MSGAKRIVIIGAGPAGICAAIHLRKAGHENVTLYEKAAGVGGTWWHNRYPGCACDVQSHLYSFSFATKPDWSRPYAPQPEILAYFTDVADRFGVTPLVRFSTAITDAVWNEGTGSWTLTTEHGERVDADVVVSSMGMFNELNFPAIDGRESFKGTSFHSARWNHEHDLNGERVAVIGSAASAVQFLPQIAQQVAQLHVFQRSAPWILPKADTPYTEEQLASFRADPSLAAKIRADLFANLERTITFGNETLRLRAEEAGLRYLETVADPHTRRKLTPTVPFGAHRPLVSNDYYSMYNEPHVELVTDPITRITSSGVVTADGTERTVDTLIYATGFQPTKYLSAINVVGRNGVRIDEAWNKGAEAYLGITTSGFPNLFMTYGPNTNNGSILEMIETQVAYIVRQVDRLVNDALAWIDVKADAMATYNAALQADLDNVEVWNRGGHNYYRAESGRIVTQWPHNMTAYRDRTAVDDTEVYETRRA